MLLARQRGVVKNLTEVYGKGRFPDFPTVVGVGALGLVLNAIAVWNSRYMAAALDHLRSTEGNVPPRRAPRPSLTRSLDRSSVPILLGDLYRGHAPPGVRKSQGARAAR